MIESSKAFDLFRTKLTAFVYPSEHKAKDTRLKTDDEIIGHHDEDIGVKVPTQDENQGNGNENVLEETYRRLPRWYKLPMLFPIRAGCL